MQGLCFSKCGFTRVMAVIQIIIGVFVIFISIANLHRFYSTSPLFHDNKDASQKFHTLKEGYADFDLKALSDRVDDVVTQLSELQEKLESTVQNIGKNKNKDNTKKEAALAQNITMSEFKRFLEEEVIQPLYSAHIALRLIRIPQPEDGSVSGSIVEDPLINFFTVEETRKYITSKGNRGAKLSVYSTNKTYNTIGHACVLMRKELEEYMNYDIGSYCNDDWNLGQKLMLGGCDPLPRRRCLTRASKLYQRPLPINESLWTMPDNRNVRWSKYQCRDFKCLSSKNPRRGFSKCIGCFELEKEKVKWVKNGSLADFLIKDVLAVKPGEIRIGLDVSIGTGSFAARMREFDVTIISTALNVGAPFSEMIALRGLIPLYTTVSQRLPLFDNTMDMIHTSVFLDGWIDLQLLDFILFDWDRVLRPGGLLWVDKFFCSRKDLDDFMYMFLQFRYKKHKWVVSFKSKDEVYLSALLEKPPRSL
ncbi:probable methyltransferase At1g29790 isoform X2 [Typha angustifolia]